MDETIKTSIAIQKTLFDQAERLAQDLNISQSDLFELAITYFIQNYHHQTALDELPRPVDGQPTPNISVQTSTARRIISQGDIYWVQSEDASGTEAGIPHPHVVVQDNVFNHSRIPTVVACALTSNMKRANLPGNVLLEEGEGNLSKQSVVEISKVSTIEKAQLGEYIGSLSEKRIDQILAGMRFLHLSFFGH